MNIKICRAVVAFSFLLVLSSCSVAGDKATSNVSDKANQLKLSISNSDILVDFRDPETQNVANGGLGIGSAGTEEVSNAFEKQTVETIWGEGAFDRFRLGATVQGSFTNKGLQTLHILINRKMTAVEKKVTPSILVIAQDNKTLTQFIPTKAAYLSVASVLDIDNDGLNEVLLTAASYQMGTQFVIADLYSFKKPSDILKQELGVVYTNACGSPFADARNIRASTLSIAPGNDGLMANNYVAPCNINNEPPSADLYTAEPDPQQK